MDTQISGPFNLYLNWCNRQGHHTQVHQKRSVYLFSYTAYLLLEITPKPIDSVSRTSAYTTPAMVLVIRATGASKMQTSLFRTYSISSDQMKGSGFWFYQIVVSQGNGRETFGKSKNQDTNSSNIIVRVIYTCAFTLHVIAMNSQKRWSSQTYSKVTSPISMAAPTSKDSTS